MVAHAACGRIGYDSALGSRRSGEGAPPPPVGSGALAPPHCNNLEVDGDEEEVDCGGSCNACNFRFISPSGTNGAPGTEGYPWKTWGYALSQQRPGMTLVALDGNYGGSSGTGNLELDCSEGARTCHGAPCEHGTADAPITVKANVERRARLEWTPESKRASIDIRHCRHWTIEGFTTLGGEQRTPSDNRVAAPVMLIDDDFITLRRLIALKPNPFARSRAISVEHSRDVLLEDSEAYDFHEIGLHVYHSDRVVLRRNYVNGRNFASTAEFPTSCGDAAVAGIYLNGTSKAVVENNVVEDACESIVLTVGQPREGEAGDDNQLLSNIAFKPLRRGILLSSSCGGDDPCVEPDLTLERSVVDNNVIIASAADGILHTGGLETLFTHNSSLDHHGVGFNASLSSANQGLAATFTSERDLMSASASVGFRISPSDAWSWAIIEANSYGHATNYLPLTGEVDNSSQVDPELDSCLVYRPLGSAAATMDVGAQITHRTVNGSLQPTQPLWTSESGAFSCGAFAEGVNDKVGSSCLDVHERLHVGHGGCPLPAELRP